MKINHLSIITAAALVLAGPTSVVLAQQITTETRTTNISGSVQQFAPDAVTVTTTSAEAPTRYQISKTTRYVDDEGNPVSVEVVRSGAPVTVYYASAGDQMTASRIVVHKVSSTATASGETAVVSESEPVTAVGTVTQFGDGLFSVRGSADAPPTQYYFSKTTKYVDSDGNPVAVSYVKSGVPVTVQYARIGDRMVASKVIVKRTRKVVVPATEAVQQSTTTVSEPAPAPAPVVHKKTTTTTTTQGED